MSNPIELDVRPILKNGGEPFGAIMAAVNGLKPGQGLKLFATFKPVPLFRVMETKGFGYEATELDAGDWQVVFTPMEGGGEAGISSPDNPETWADPTHYLDCTDLDPPQPMVEILGRLESMGEGEVLLALLGREPVFLFPELQARGHAWVGDFDETGDAYRLMVRVGRRT